MLYSQGANCMFLSHSDNFGNVCVVAQLFDTFHILCHVVALCGP